MKQSDPAAELQAAYFELLTASVIGCPMYDRVPHDPPRSYVCFDGVVSNPHNTKTSRGVDAIVVLTVWSSFDHGEGTKMLANEIANKIVEALTDAVLEIASGWEVVSTRWLDASPVEDFEETRVWYRRIVRFQHNVEQA
jgi:hypothetical protein